jgi:hypothetical protein
LLVQDVQIPNQYPPEVNNCSVFGE